MTMGTTDKGALAQAPGVTTHAQAPDEDRALTQEDIDAISPEAATDDAEVKSGRWFCPSCHDFQSGKRCDHCGLPPPSPSSPEAVAQREPEADDYASAEAEWSKLPHVCGTLSPTTGEALRFGVRWGWGRGAK